MSGLSRTLALLSTAAVLVFAGCTSEDPDTTVSPGSVPVTTLDLSEVEDVTDLDSRAPTVVTPSGSREQSDTVIPADSARSLGEFRVLVSGFVAPCATVTAAEFTADAEAVLYVADMDCSEDRVMVSVIISEPQPPEPTP